MIVPHPDVTDDPRAAENVTVLALKRLSIAQGLTLELATHEKGCSPCGSTWERCPEGAALAVREQAAWEALEAAP